MRKIKILFVVFIIMIAIYIPKVDAKIVCKKATKLHTDICNKGATCDSNGYSVGDTIIYGNFGANDYLSGTAFDCDVNGDGIYSSDTERFYYVTDLESDSNYAVLIYYNNVSGGVSNNTALFTYNTQNDTSSYYGPSTALLQLPLSSQWKNVRLSSTIRDIKDENGEVFVPKFSYNNYAARLLTIQEVNKACNITSENHVNNELNNCNYLLENTKYSNSGLTYGYWLESVLKRDESYHYQHAYVINSDTNNVYSHVIHSMVPGKYGDIEALTYGVRPVIEVPKNEINNKKEIVDNNITIEESTNGSLINVSKLEIKKLQSNTETYNKINSIFKDKKNFIAYDFNLYDIANNHIEPTGMVTVKIKIPSGFNKDKIKVWYVDDKYNTKEIKHSIVDEKIIFETNHFSTYVITEDNNISTQTVQVGNTFKTAYIGYCIGIAILILGIIVIYQSYRHYKKEI